MSKFEINASWGKAEGNSFEEATRANVRIMLGATNLTEYTEERVTSESLDIPSYFLAEWIAENWWPLLFEPRKSEDDLEDGPDFLSRHSLLTAQHGYALPAIRIVPNGKVINVSARGREVPFADIRFRRSASLMLAREAVAQELKAFVSKTVKSLEKHVVLDTDLQTVWSAVQETTPEEESYCQMIGALGLSPYADNSAIDELLFQLEEVAGERFAMDLCLVARPHDFASFVRNATAAKTATEGAPEADLTPLLSVPLPAENFLTPAWKRGVQAAQKVRAELGVKNTDPTGGTSLLVALGLAPTVGGATPDAELLSDEGMPIVGAVVREEHKVRVGLLQRGKPQRRFATARAAYAAWTSESNCGRLLTQAVTRDQQSSRAFAAEMMAPFEFIRGQATKGRLSRDVISDLASELSVAADVVWKQAVNNGLTLERY